MAWLESKNAYDQEARNEEERVATPTSFSIFDFYDMKTLQFRFDHEIFTCFQLFYEMKLKTSKLKSWHF